MLTVFVGDIYQDLADRACQHDSSAYLVNESNCEQVHTGTVYTSLGDLRTLDLFWKFLYTADEIYYCPRAKWSDHKTVNHLDVWDSIQGCTEFALMTFSKGGKVVHNLDLSHYQHPSYLALMQTERKDDCVLWIAGDSFSAGFAVESHEKFAHILEQRLNMQMQMLATPGASIEWCADQILRSDIRANDIIVWVLPPVSRFTMWSDNEKYPVHLGPNHRKFKLSQLIHLSESEIDKLLVRNQCFYQGIIHIHQVNNFCKKIGANLLITSHPQAGPVSALLPLYLYNLPNLFQIYDQTGFKQHLVDFGSNNSHPGPIEHKNTADFLLDQLRHLNYI